MNKIIEEIYQSKSVVGSSGNVLKLHSEVDRREGEFLYNIIQNDLNVRKTLEIGCAYGLSSLHICEALHGRENAEHILVDPFQHTQWESVGIINLEKAGIDFFKLIETKSEFALPRLAEQEENQFDFIFVDGWHTFDHTLVDCFYANRLLRVGGYLVIDDVNMPSVRRVADFFKTYPCYEELSSITVGRVSSLKRTFSRIGMFPIDIFGLTALFKSDLRHKIYDNDYTTMIAFKKTAEDNRNWDWHNDDF